MNTSTFAGWAKRWEGKVEDKERLAMQAFQTDPYYLSHDDLIFWLGKGGELITPQLTAEAGELHWNRLRDICYKVAVQQQAAYKKAGIFKHGNDMASAMQRIFFSPIKTNRSEMDSMLADVVEGRHFAESPAATATRKAAVHAEVSTKDIIKETMGVKRSLQESMQQLASPMAVRKSASGRSSSSTSAAADVAAVKRSQADPEEDAMDVGDEEQEASVVAEQEMLRVMNAAVSLFLYALVFVVDKDTRIRLVSLYESKRLELPAKHQDQQRYLAMTEIMFLAKQQLQLTVVKEKVPFDCMGLKPDKFSRRDQQELNVYFSNFKLLLAELRENHISLSDAGKWIQVKQLMAPEEVARVKELVTGELGFAKADRVVDRITNDETGGWKNSMKKHTQSAAPPVKPADGSERKRSAFGAGN